MDNVLLKIILAKNVANLMVNGDMNQADLAAKSKLSQKTVSNIIRPALPYLTNDQLQLLPFPTLSVIGKIAQTLNTTPWQLLHPKPKEAQLLNEFLSKFSVDVINKNISNDIFGGKRFESNQSNQYNQLTN